MTIYIHPFVLGILFTIVMELGICFVVGLIASRKALSVDDATPEEETVAEPEEKEGD